MIYVLKMDNPEHPEHRGLPTRVRFIGPFADNIAAADWATDDCNNPHDDPRWQVVDMACPTCTIEEP